MRRQTDERCMVGGCGIREETWETAALGAVGDAWLAGEGSGGSGYSV